ncbi:MAG: glucose-6-phosphate dehydrogenase, partial [Firmicutes bacterium]|nr:glucose-6-phosphate dehydrogenase [Bacillota bacterium]
TPQNVGSLAVRGQYDAGKIAGKAVVGYHQEPHIPSSSITETYAAVKLFINTWRWDGVPFYLRSGKRLAADYAEIAVELKAVPSGFFGGGKTNWVIFQLKPEESIAVTMWSKTPGATFQVEPLTLSGLYKKGVAEEYSPYEQLLYDVLQGDHTAFPRFDEVEAAWRIMDPILTAWKTGQPETYVAGSQGPAGQDALMEPGQQWRILE